MLDIVSV